MSSTKFPCGCKIEYDINDVVVNVEYCDKHEKLCNDRLNIEDNASNLEDQIYKEYEW